VGLGRRIWLRLLTYVGGGFTVLGATLAAGVVGMRLLAGRRWRRQLNLRSQPRWRARRLARELRFYLTMSRLLDRHGYSRPAWQAPGDFAGSVVKRQPATMGPVGPLTELFYEVRFGGVSLDAGRREQAQGLLRRLRVNLQAVGARGNAVVEIK
jgi:protein-glutamine gamma-glutamyltransferase